MSRLKIINLVLLTAIISGCAQFDAFVDRRREAGAKSAETLYVGASKPGKPAICYNSLITPYKDVKKMADEECAAYKERTHAIPVKQTMFTCRLFVPNHIYFKCERY